VDKLKVSLFIIAVLCSGLVAAQVIGSYKTSTTSITLGKTTVTYSATVPKDDDYIVICPGVQFMMSASNLTRDIQVTKTRLQKVDFSKCIIWDVTAQSLVASSVRITGAMG
jgi:hypothetical protein